MANNHDSETPADGQQVLTACAFIHRSVDGEHQVFLPKRAATKKFLPNKFELPGGHVDYGEEMVAGLIREIDEEFGVAVSVGDPFAAFTYVNEVKGSHSLELVYFAQFTDENPDITLNPSDHSEAGWYSRDEALTLNGDDEEEEVAVLRKGFDLLEGKSVDLS